MSRRPQSGVKNRIQSAKTTISQNKSSRSNVKLSKPGPNRPQSAVGVNDLHFRRQNYLGRNLKSKKSATPLGGLPNLNSEESKINVTQRNSVLPRTRGSQVPNEQPRQGEPGYAVEDTGERSKQV